MSKRVISFTLTLIMMLGIFIVPSASADDIKILASKTLKVGQTADVRLTDPSTGAKLNTLWESTNPSVATVTSDGTVKGVKAGNCTVYTYWNSKYYGVSVTVTGSSPSSTKKASSGSSAYTKLKNYLIKKGTTQTNSSGEKIYYIKWENKKYRYWINYNSTGKYMEYTGVVRRNSSTDYGYVKFFQYESQNKLTAAFAWTKNGTQTNVGYYSKDYKKSKFNIKNKIKVKHQSGKKISKANTLANKYRKLFYPKWNKWLKKKVKVSLKSLGLMYSKAKKISINKKSATLIKGKTLKLKLKNAKASKVKWSSSKKKVATVSKKGKVKAKKKGKATITAKYKGKKYKCKITVKNKAKKKSLTVKQAFNKLKNYLIKNGTKNSLGNGTDYLYQVKWTKQGFSYLLDYHSRLKDICFTGEYETSSVDLITNLYVDTKSKSRCQFYSKTNNDESTHYYMAANFVKKSFVLENIPDFTFDGGNNQGYDKMNMNAKAALEWMFPDFNTYISKKAGVTMKQLGFKKWK